MKYTIEMDIPVSRDKVIELFDNADNLKKWQPELISFDHISGEPGQEGAKSKLVYKMGKRDIEMIETITKQNFPDEFDGTYETAGMWNMIENTFEPTESGTKWTMSSEFKCSSFFMKCMMFFAPGSFKKQTLKFMNQFREFVEAEVAHSHAD